MFRRTVARLVVLCVAMLAIGPAAARAQFTPQKLNDPPTGEQFHIEGSIGLWMPGTEMNISSEALGIQGSEIDFKKDLGLSDQKFPEFRIVLRPARKHKLRYQYIPINFDQEATLTRDVVFQGIKYRVGIPVNSQLQWKAHRFTYEYDVIARNWGFAGFMLDAKYSDVLAALQSPVDYEYVHARFPVPTLGGIGRYYVAPNISITGELTLFKLSDITVPGKSQKASGHYGEFDIYGTVNLTNNFGAQIGYHDLDLGYSLSKNAIPTDTGSFVMKGLYFSGVARF